MIVWIIYARNTLSMTRLRQLTWGAGFSLWTVTRAAWHTVLKSKVSGVLTDAALFSANGSQLVHHYRVCGQCVAHVSLHGTFMIDLRYFTFRASADAKWSAKQDRTPYSPEPLSRSIRQRGSDDESPACKAPQAGSPLMPNRSAHAATTTITSADKYSAPAVPEFRLVLYGGWRPSLPVSLPLPRFANRLSPRFPDVHCLRESG